MKKQALAKLCLAVALIFGMTACETVPYTGRSQLVLMSPQQELALGQQASDQVRQEYKISTNPRYTAPVERVGRRIAQAANQPDYQWSFTTVEDKSLNAFALPGGKVFVNTGMVDFAGSDSMLATVIAHEIAHVIARHGAERMSRVLMAQMGGAVLAGAFNITVRDNFFYHVDFKRRFDDSKGDKLLLTTSTNLAWFSMMFRMMLLR